MYGNDWLILWISHPLFLNISFLDLYGDQVKDDPNSCFLNLPKPTQTCNVTKPNPVLKVKQHIVIVMKCAGMINEVDFGLSPIEIKSQIMSSHY